MLTGLAAWLVRIKRLDIRVRIVLRWGVGRRFSSAEIGQELYAHCFQLWEKLSCDVQFFVDSRSLQEHFFSLYQKRFSCTPIGVNFSEIPDIPFFTEKSSYCFVFAGAPRLSKGGQLLASAIIDHLISYPEDRFRIHLLGLDSEEESIFGLLPSNRVELLYQYLEGKDYINYLMSGDVVLVPYSPEHYHLRTSHIFLEALGLGKPVVASGHPWMKHMLDGFAVPVGVVMEEWTATGLTKAMRAIRENVVELSQNAIANSKSVREQHNPKAWLECVLNV